MKLKNLSFTLLMLISSLALASDADSDSGYENSIVTQSSIVITNVSEFTGDILLVKASGNCMPTVLSFGLAPKSQKTIPVVLYDEKECSYRIDNRPLKIEQNTVIHITCEVDQIINVDQAPLNFVGCDSMAFG